MGYPAELKEQILVRVLANEISAQEASKQYRVGYSTILSWVKAARGKETKKEIMPLPTGMTLYQAIVASGHCQICGYDSKAAGEYCRKIGAKLEEIEEFGKWMAQHEAVVLEDQARNREKELIAQATQVRAENAIQAKELKRKDKALAEAAALLVLSKKARAIWGDKGD